MTPLAPRCPCGLPLHDEVNALRAEVERLTRERDEARADAARLHEEAKSLENIIASLERRMDGPAGMRATNERLRGLIAEVEWHNFEHCLWCGRIDEDDHAPGCPAFSARGEVRRT